MKINIIRIVCLLMWVNSGFAFHISEHAKITQRALANLANCHKLNPIFSASVQDILVQANESEDTDLIRKWAYYSHYYNPYKKLDMRRADSSVSVIESRDEILKILSRGELELTSSGGAIDLLGRIVHHLQDSAAIVHVVPVSHFISDGFEEFAMDEYWSAPTSVRCEALVKDPMGILYDTAVTTLKRGEEKFEITTGGKTYQQSWLGSFWQMGYGNEFGEYGPLGDNFGKTDFNTDGGHFSVPAKEFSRFKAESLDAAIQSTESAILWFQSVLLPYLNLQVFEPLSVPVENN